MIPLLIGAGLAAGGAIAGMAGANSEARRKHKAIKRAQHDNEAVTNAIIDSYGRSGATQQNALLAHLMRMEGGTMDDATADAGARTAAIDARAAGVPALDSSNDPVAQAAYAKTAGRAAVQRKASDSIALLRSLTDANRESGSMADVNASAARVPLNEELYAAERARQEINQRLAGVMGTTGNSAANLQLLAGVLNAGSAGSFGMAGRV